MPISKQAKRRKLAQFSSALVNEALALDTKWHSKALSALQLGDLASIESMMDCDDEDAVSAKLVNGVAIVPVCGPLRDESDWMVKYYGASCYEGIEAQVTQACDNANVKAIVLWVNSPGGQAIGCKRAADLIKSKRGTKPIVAYVQGMACSAAYYLASSTDKIYATADSIGGSIGTIYTHNEISKLARDIGYKFTVITNADSPKKGHGNMYEPLTDASRKTLADFVDSFGKAFIGDVASYRGVSEDRVIARFGQGDSFLSPECVKRGIFDQLVDNWSSLLAILTGDGGDPCATEKRGEEPEPIDPARPPTPEPDPESHAAATLPTQVLQTRRIPVKKLKAQLYAMGLLDSIEATDELAMAALRGFCAARGLDTPSAEAEQLKVLQGGTLAQVVAASAAPLQPIQSAPAANVQAAHQKEFDEARNQGFQNAKTAFVDLSASAALFNERHADAVSAEMVADAFEKGLTCSQAIKVWTEKLTAAAGANNGNATKVAHVATHADQFGPDAVSALLHKVTNGEEKLTPASEKLLNMPLWAIAAKSLENHGEKVDMYGDHESLAVRAMEMQGNRRHSFYSERERRQYVGAEGNVPYTRPGDFPNILSALANKFLDTVDLDEFSYGDWTAVLPNGLRDFKPMTMVNKGIVEEMDEVRDAESFKELGMAEEVLSYVWLRRFGNKFGWTPVLVANDDLNAFAEGMIGLGEAWATSQSRLCTDLLTSNPTLLDGSALYRTANDVTSGAAPSDTQWAAMETKYADITGVSTTRRVRGSLNVCLTPTGTQYQEARRTFWTLNQLEPKMAATTANVGLYRGQIAVIPEGELRGNSTTKFYGFRNPTQVRTATIVRAYFNGFGVEGKRERWYDPENKTTWVSLEGRIGAAIKNWRYTVRNAGA